MTSVRPLLRVLGISLAFAALVYGLSFLVAPTYGSYFTLYFPNASPVPGLGAALRTPNEQDQAAVRNLGGALTSPLVGSGTQTATGILQSSGVLRAVLSELQLPQKWKASPNEAYKRLRASSSVTVDRTGFLRVEATGDSPEQAVEILNALYRRLESRAEQLTLNVSRRNREFIERRVADAEARVNRLQARVVRSLEQSAQGDFDSLAKALAELKTRYTEAKVQEMAGRAALESRERLLMTVLREGESSPGKASALLQLNESLAGLATELQSRRVALEDTLNEFTETSPEVRRARRQLGAPERVARSLIQDQLKSVQQRTTPELIEARSQLQALETTTSFYEDLIRRIEARLNPAAQQFAESQRVSKEFEAALGGLATLRTELELARIAELRDPSRFEMVDDPQPDPEPVAPRRVLSAGIGFLVALLLQIWPLAVRLLREGPGSQA